MSQADESDNRGGLHEIHVATQSAEQSPRAISESGGRAKRHEGVHVGATDLELVPCAAIEARASEDLHYAGQRQRKPAEPGRQAKSEHPFSQHERRGAEGAYPKVELPGAQFALTRFGCLLIGDAGVVARVLDSLDHGGNTGFSSRRPTHGGMISFEAYSRAADATHTLDGLGHVPGAIAAGHARDGEFGPGWRDRLRIALWFQFGRQFSPHSLDRVYANKEECLTRIFYAVASEYPVPLSRATISRGAVGEPSQYRPT